MKRTTMFVSLAATATFLSGWDAKSYKKPAASELKQKLTPLQFSVTQEDDTERPFKNEYWDSKEAGIYVDVVSGEPLFSSLDKFDSGTGWPSFTKPLAKEHIVERVDKSLFTSRTEVRSKHGNSHLGHVFDDGPAPTGLRYCMNSASMRFVPVSKLASEGYAEYLPLFAKKESKSEVPTKKTAVFAGGCFWCMETPFEELSGVESVVSGYTAGKVLNPTYEQVSDGGTGHLEAIKVTYDPIKISYEKLLDVFWHNIDPTDAGGQFVDRGDQYRSAIFAANDAEKKAAESSRDALSKKGVFKAKIVTEILSLGTFYDAEDYHQDYYKKNPIKYRYYRHGSGRDQFLEKTWGEKHK